MTVDQRAEYAAANRIAYQQGHRDGSADRANGGRCRPGDNNPYLAEPRKARKAKPGPGVQFQAWAYANGYFLGYGGPGYYG